MDDSSENSRPTTPTVIPAYAGIHALVVCQPRTTTPTPFSSLVVFSDNRHERLLRNRSRPTRRRGDPWRLSHKSRAHISLAKGATITAGVGCPFTPKHNHSYRHSCEGRNPKFPDKRGWLFMRRAPCGQPSPAPRMFSFQAARVEPHEIFRTQRSEVRNLKSAPPKTRPLRTNFFPSAISVPSAVNLHPVMSGIPYPSH